MISDEELELCRKLPQPDFHDLEEFSIIQLQDPPFDGEIVVVTKKYEGKVVTLNDFYFDHGNPPKFILIPHPHQIMAMKEWPEDYYLGREGDEWWVSRYIEKRDYYVEDLIDDGNTARLACLRAIVPLLERDVE